MASGEREARSGAGIQVIARVGSILRTLSDQRDGLSLSELAERVALPRSTVHRIIAALESEGLATTAAAGDRYQLGPELLRLAAGQHRELRSALHPRLQRLSLETNETVDLCVLIADQVSFIDQVAAPHRLRAVSAIGESFAAHCTAPGKALLADLEPDVLRQLLPARLRAATPNTVIGRDRLEAELAEVRAHGFASDHEEHTLGISAVGAVVRDVFGPVAAVSIPVPTRRFEGVEHALARALVAAAVEMSAVLGAPPV